MTEPSPPGLPAGAPQELQDFIACRRNSVTINSGTLEWLLPPGSDMPAPEVTLNPGSSPGTGVITVGIGFVSVDVGVAIVDGALEVDAGALSIVPDAQQAIDDWVRQFNDFLKARRRRLRPATIRDGSVTLEKEPVPAPAGPAVPPPPTDPMPSGPGSGGAPQPPAPQPPAPKADGDKGCLTWLLGLLGLALVGVVGAVATGFIPLPGGGPSGSPGASPAGSAAPSVVAASPGGPMASAGGSASVAPSTPGGEGAEAAGSFLVENGILTADELAGIPWLIDDTADWFLPQPGSEPVQQPLAVDILRAAGWEVDISPDTATAVSEAAPCDVDGASNGWTYRTACNQNVPLPDGRWVVIITEHAGGVAADFPPAGLHSWSVSSDVDRDPATGFSSSLPDNYLIGADIYHELLFFQSQGQERSYILATRPADPPRPDTGETQGNVRTAARVAWFRDLGVSVWVIPDGDFGPNWYAGGFATTDRGANSPATLAADALGDPGEQGFRSYADLLGLPPP